MHVCKRKDVSAKIVKKFKWIPGNEKIDDPCIIVFLQQHKINLIEINNDFVLGPRIKIKNKWRRNDKKANYNFIYYIKNKIFLTLILLSEEFVINNGSFGRNFSPDIGPQWASLISLCNRLLSKSQTAICPILDAEAIIEAPSERTIFKQN